MVGSRSPIRGCWIAGLHIWDYPHGCFTFAPPTRFIPVVVYWLFTVGLPTVLLLLVRLPRFTVDHFGCYIVTFPLDILHVDLKRAFPHFAVADRWFALHLIPHIPDCPVDVATARSTAWRCVLYGSTGTHYPHATCCQVVRFYRYYPTVDTVCLTLHVPVYGPSRLLDNFDCLLVILRRSPTFTARSVTHGCTRLPTVVALLILVWVPQFTTVVIWFCCVCQFYVDLTGLVTVLLRGCTVAHAFATCVLHRCSGARCGCV